MELTRKQAIEELKAILEMQYWNVPLSKAALEMAIKALEQEPTTKNDLGVDKTFYEQIVEYCNEHFLVLVEKDVWEDAEKALTTKNDLAVDAVSRQAVIGTIYDNKSDFKNDFAQGFFADKIRELPSVTPQEPVLDKLREEIKVMTSNRGFLSCSVGYIHKEIDKVFDKYKAETEVEV